MSSRAAKLVPGTIGVLIVLAVWELVGRTAFTRTGIIPPPTRILAHMGDDGFRFYFNNSITTLKEAGWGFLWGNLIAIGLAIAFVVVPLAERALMQVALASYCLPVVAIGPVLAILFSGLTPKIILAALSVVFTTLIGTLVGLRQADPTSLELIRAYGGGRLAQLWRVRLRASLPSMFAGLSIAAPAAMLGAIIGEYLGADNGLGIAMIISEQAFDVPRTWGLALVATALSGLAYGLVALIGRLLTPWAPRV